MAALLGEQPRPGSEQQEVQGGNNAAADVKTEPGAGVKQEAAGGAPAPMDVDGEAGGDSQQVAAAAGEAAQQQAADAPGPLQASGSSAHLFKEEPQEHAQQTAAQPPAAQQQQAGLPPRPPSPQQAGGGAQKPPLHPNLARVKAADSSAQPSSAGVSQSGAEGGTETEAGTTVDQEAQPLRPVSTLRQTCLARPPSCSCWHGAHCRGLAVLLSGIFYSRMHGCGGAPPTRSLAHRNDPPVTPTPSPQVCVNDDMDDSDAEHAYLREKRMRRPARVWRSARERAVWLRMTQAAESAEQAAYCTWILCDRWAACRTGMGRARMRGQLYCTVAATSGFPPPLRWRAHGRLLCQPA